MKELLHLDSNAAVSREGDVLPVDDVFSNLGTEYHPDEMNDLIDYLAEDDKSPADPMTKMPEAKPGASVSLADRREALEAIAAIYGQRNRARGFSHASETPPMRQEIARRYRDPRVVADAMAQKASGQLGSLGYHMTILTQERALKDAGFSYDEVDTAAGLTENDIRQAFGEGTRYSDREKRLRRVRKAAKHATRQTIPRGK